MELFTDLDLFYLEDGEGGRARSTYDEVHTAGKLVNLEFRLASKDPRKLNRAVASYRLFQQRMYEMSNANRNV